VTDGHINNSFPNHDRLAFKVIETDEQRASLYNHTRQEIIRILMEGYEDYTSEIKREQRVLDDGTRITEEITVETPTRRYWMTVPEILKILREKNPKTNLATTKAYYHLGKLHEQEILEQYPEDSPTKKKRVRGRYFRISAKFFVDVTVEASVGYSGPAVMPEEIGPRFLKFAENVRETGAAASFDYQVNLDGVLLWLSMTMSLHRDKMNLVAVVRDITTHRSLEQQLARTESDLGRLIGESFQGYAVIQNGRLVLFNPAYSKTVGRSKRELEQMSTEEVWSLIHPDDRENLQQRNNQMSQGIKELPRIRFRYIRPDGTIRWVEAFGRLTEHLGKPALLTLEIDITDRLEAELELQKNEQRNRMIASAMSDLVLTFDAKDRYNEYFGDSSLLLCPWDEMKGKKQKDFLPKDITDKYNKIITEVRENGESVVYEFELELHGTKRWLQSTVILHEDKEKIVIALKDVSERKSVEVSLRRSEKRFRNLFENAQVGIFHASIDNGKILRINETGAKMFGYDSIDDALANFITSYHYVNPDTRASLLKEMKEKGVSSSGPTLMTKKDGSQIVVEFYSRIYPDEGYNEAVAIDITEKYQTEQNLRESEQRYRKLVEHIPEMEKTGVALEISKENYSILFNSISDSIILLENNKIVKANSPTTELIGYERRDILGKTIWGLSPRRQPNKQLSKGLFLEKIKQSLEGNPQSFLWMYRNADGENIDADVTITSLKNEGTELIQVLSHPRNIK